MMMGRPQGRGPDGRAPMQRGGGPFMGLSAPVERSKDFRGTLRKLVARLRLALRGEIADATVLIVAQRVSTILHADHIVVLDEGRIVGAGTHAELMRSSAEYREIVESQLGAAAA